MVRKDGADLSRDRDSNPGLSVGPPTALPTERTPAVRPSRPRRDSIPVTGGWNAERRRLHKAQDPDLPHPYRPRKVTADRLGWGATHYLLRRPSWYDERAKTWRQGGPMPSPCRVCGGSEGLPIHDQA